TVASCARGVAPLDGSLPRDGSSAVPAHEGRSGADAGKQIRTNRVRDDDKALLPHGPRHASRHAQSTALTSTTTSLRIPKTRTCREPKKSSFGSFRQI